MNIRERWRPASGKDFLVRYIRLNDEERDYEVEVHDGADWRGVGEVLYSDYDEEWRGRVGSEEWTSHSSRRAAALGLIDRAEWRNVSRPVVVSQIVTTLQKYVVFDA
jgi:hypothetical protein